MQREIKVLRGRESSCVVLFEDSCHTPATCSSGKNHTNNAFHFYMQVGACSGQLAWHHKASGAQREQRLKSL